MARDNYGNKNIVKKIRITPSAIKGRGSYVIDQSDRLDILSYRFYNNPTKFWLISDANKEMYPDDILRKGNSITIGEERF